MIFVSAQGGPIWIKFRRLVQNVMSIAVICGNGNHMYNSNMADVCANSMACHPRATYHIAGCCHLRNSLQFTVMIPEPHDSELEWCKF